VTDPTWPSAFAPVEELRTGDGVPSTEGQAQEASPPEDADSLPAAVVALFERLAAEPYAFDFFQAVRRLECAGDAGGRPRIGTSVRAGQDAVRFAQYPSLEFAPSTVAAFAPPDPEGRWAARMSVNFMGMWGPNGPLPLHLTEYARDRLRNCADPTLARFMDVFHHRMTSLFYRAWAVNQQVVAADRARPGYGIGGTGGADGVESDRFAVYVASLIGRGMSSLRGRDAVPDDAKLHWSGHLSGETSHAEGLEAILTGHFGYPCRVLPFAGQWIDLPPESRCMLGRSRETGALGQTTIVGSRVWDCQGKFRIRLGPMPLREFARMLPGQPGNRQLRDWIRNYAGDQLAWEARVVLASVAVPGVRLGGGAGQLGGAGLLGWSTWLPTDGRPRRDADDLILHS
jgi:type VI secretion system protein ImpH